MLHISPPRFWIELALTPPLLAAVVAGTSASPSRATHPLMRYDIHAIRSCFAELSDVVRADLPPPPDMIGLSASARRNVLLVSFQLNLKVAGPRHGSWSSSAGTRRTRAVAATSSSRL